MASHVERALGGGGRGDDDAAAAERPAFELFCGDQRLPPDMTLMTARVYVWRQPGDMQLLYAAAPPP